jgi:hypothetical protein
MTEKESQPIKIEDVGRGLFDFALEREDIKWLLARLPGGQEVNPATVEYELQILKIVSVGWSIAFHMESHPWKTPLQEVFWQAIREFSENLSTATELMIGHDVNYFQVLKDRLDMYVKALEAQPDAAEPVQVIGPAFASTCGKENDLVISMSGSKIFTSALGQVKTYLSALGLC